MKENTPEREATLKKRFESIDEAVKKDSDPFPTLIEWLELYTGEEGIADDLDDDEILELYKEKVSNLVADDGRIIGDLETPYTVKGKPYCCVREMSKVGEDRYSCAYCEREYEINVPD